MRTLLETTAQEVNGKKAAVITYYEKIDSRVQSEMTLISATDSPDKTWFLARSPQREDMTRFAHYPQDLYEQACNIEDFFETDVELMNLYVNNANSIDSLILPEVIGHNSEDSKAFVDKLSAALSDMDCKIFDNTKKFTGTDIFIPAEFLSKLMLHFSVDERTSWVMAPAATMQGIYKAGKVTLPDNRGKYNVYVHPSLIDTILMLSYSSDFFSYPAVVDTNTLTHERSIKLINKALLAKCNIVYEEN